MALLCNRCNLNEGDIPADSPEGRKALIQRNGKVYGFARMFAAWCKFRDILVDNNVTPLYEIETLVEQIDEEA